MLREVWEGIAGDVLGQTGFDDPPVDAFDLAAACGLRIHLISGSTAELDGDVIRVPRKARPSRQHGLIAHELAHWLLTEYNEDNTERAARYLGGCLLLPRAQFQRDAERVGFALHELAKIHVNSSYESLLWRCAQLSEARGSVWDFGKLTYSIGERWPGDRELIEQALETELPACSGDAWASPVFVNGWRRVVAVRPSALAL